ncbi:histidinol-phosphate transaminase [Endozoicomonas sp. SCSIO W0465]|uniref:pyridoxal phosphate-dependent aminotransferase n=1 Tax=Endozoicomonas sp. SCSIO W0465 TaxID=2918516 RepID=UPI0020751E59|nr:histidinol-phosphate transaminase [Endozoicomonas sp. SCSIO W0465]USE37784.1 histidinol-phosphate aminotransferase family protein [Endozoicomonas sp. SCSIO W0465]
MNIFKSHIIQMIAYVPPLEGRNPHHHLLLDFNERTRPVSEHVKQALINYISEDRLQVYPSYGDLTRKIADYAGINEPQVMITNGSDQGIDIIIRAACTEGDEIIIPVPTFAMYHQCARIAKLNVVEPEYTRETGFPVSALLDAITPKTRLIVIANPNNPSGTRIHRNDILTIARSAPDIALLVDECYFEYSQETVADAVMEYPNILITRTFSKTWGLPSIRLGYVISHPDNIRALLNIRGPYDVNQFAAVAISAALDHPEYTHQYVREVMEESKPLFEQFLDQQAIPYWPSSANFIWAFPDNPDVIEQHLRRHGILVRPRSDQSGHKGLRITLGDIAQTRQLVDRIQEGLSIAGAGMMKVPLPKK